MQMIPTFIYSLCLTRHLFEIALPWLPATLRNLGVIFSRPSVCTLNTWEGWTSFTLLKIVILKILFMSLLLLGWTIFHFHLVTFKAPWKALSISQSTKDDRLDFPDFTFFFICSQLNSESVLLVFKILNYHTPILKDLLVPYYLNTVLYSKAAGWDCRFPKFSV